MFDLLKTEKILSEKKCLLAIRKMLLSDNKEIGLNALDKALPYIDAKLKLYVDKGLITEDEYFDSLLLDFKFGAVSLAKKTNSPIIPMVATGDYKRKSKNLIVQFGKPFLVGDMSLEDANKELRRIFIELLKSNYLKYQELDSNRKYKEELKKL